MYLPFSTTSFILYNIKGAVAKLSLNFYGNFHLDEAIE